MNPIVQGIPMPAPQDISTDVLLEKYAKGAETSLLDVRTRVATALASVESDPAHWQPVFFEAQQNGFVAAGRINSAAGTDIKATLINCFVQPVGDSVSETRDGMPSIYGALAQAAETMRRGGGVGYDFSRIRPTGAKVKGTASRASGPISFMGVFDASCVTVESAGARRGAQMAVLRCDHPDILAFIHAKDTGKLTNFNMSIGVTDAFMRAVANGGQVELVHVAEPSDDLRTAGAYQRTDGAWVYQSLPAHDLWEHVVRSTYDHAEPGILFLDRANQENNLHYVEKLEACNPCAEQFLPAYGCCCLGSINLTLYVQRAFTEKALFDFEAFRGEVRTAVRMLDNVLDATYWPLPEQKAEAMAKRRIGLGFLGLGDALIMLCQRYDSDEGRATANRIAEELRNASYRASIDLAKEKGAFPLFNAEPYLASGFAKRLPEDIRADIAEYGMRNSHLLSIAPTGTITLAFADNASNGIEPAFSWTYDRKKRMGDGSFKHYEVEDHAFRVYREMGGDVSNLPDYFVTALQLPATEHKKMLEVVQPFIDSSISKTVNVPEHYPYADFKNLYLEAWKAGLKGIATYRPNATLGSVLSVAGPSVEGETAQVVPQDDDPLRKQFDHRPSGDLDGITRKVEYIVLGSGKRKVYLTVNFMPVTGVVGGKEVTINRPVEFFMPAGQKDQDQQWQTAAMILLSLIGRGNPSVKDALQALRDVPHTLGPVRYGEHDKEDGTKMPVTHDSEVATVGYALQQMLYKHGFLDADGNQIPVPVLAARYVRPGLGEALSEDIEPEVTNAQPSIGTGKRCPSCRNFSYHKRDGCSICSECGFQGDCA